MRKLVPVLSKYIFFGFIHFGGYMTEKSTMFILKKLWNFFWLSIVLPLILFIAVVIVHKIDITVTVPGNVRIWGIALLVVSVTMGVAIPVRLRTLFYSKSLKLESTSVVDYLSYQKKLITVCSIAIVPASFAYMFIVSPLYMYGSVLAALYGIYSTLPFKDKIFRELRMYKIED